MVIEAAKGGHTTVVKLLLEYPNRVLMNHGQELPQLTASDQHLVEVNIRLILTLILLELIVVGLCHQYRARPACTSVQSDQVLYCWLTNFQNLILISLKMLMESVKN